MHVLRATRWIRARAGPDVLALIAVLVVCGLAQYRFLSGLDLAQINSVFDSPGTGVFLSSDSPGYIGVATSILHGGSPFDPYRPPVYPAFLALIWLLTGGVNLGAVVFAQTALMLSLPVLVYFLAMAVYPRRLVAALAAALVGSNTWILSFEIAIWSEALALWLLCAYLLVLARQLKTGSTRTLALLTLLSVAVVLEKPYFPSSPRSPVQRCW